MVGLMAVRLLIAAGFIILIAKLFKRDGNSSFRYTFGAMEILKEKYAKGEITEEEYKHKRNVLQS